MQIIINLITNIQTMKRITFLRKMLWLMLIPFLTLSCEDNLDKHYDVPDWVNSNAWEVMASGEHGEFSIFLEGAELAGFRPILEGKTIITVMAPDDDSFRTYLSAHGYSSVKDIPADELQKLIGFHLVYYSYPKDKLINYRPNGDLESDESAAYGAGIYYKHRTRSSDAPTWETTPNGERVMVYHFERFIPVFSYMYFNTKMISAKENYESVLPQSTWTGEGGFNVCDASVKEYAIATTNGYIYTVDRVIEPLETIYNELKNKDEYSEFLTLYDKVGGSQYELDNDLTDTYGETYGVDALYLHTHSKLPDIACEWPGTSYTDFEKNSREAYTVFAPTNPAINELFNNFWKEGGYASLDEVDDVALNTLFENYGFDMLFFPEDIEKALEEEDFGLDLNLSAITEKKLCSNGILYGLNKIQVPNYFNTVAGPAYRNKDARSYLYALSGSNFLSVYNSTLSKYMVMMPTVDQMFNEGISTSYSTQSLTKETEDGTVNLSSSEMQEIVQMHTVNLSTNASSTLPTEGDHVYETMASFNYWFVHDGEITCNAKFNLQLNPQNVEEPFGRFSTIGDQSNGTVYQYMNSNMFIRESNELEDDIANCNDKNYLYYAFAQLLKEAGIVSGESISLVHQSTEKVRFCIFIPTNEAIGNALASDGIPGVSGSMDESGNLNVTVTDTEALKQYLSAYFVTAANNTLTSYPYIGSSMRSGEYNTQSTACPTLRYEDNGTTLSITVNGKTFPVTPEYHYFPFAFSDGCFHLIDETF